MGLKDVKTIWKQIAEFTESNYNTYVQQLIDDGETDLPLVQLYGFGMLDPFKQTLHPYLMGIPGAIEVVAVAPDAETVSIDYEWYVTIKNPNKTEQMEQGALYIDAFRNMFKADETLGGLVDIIDFKGGEVGSPNPSADTIAVTVVRASAQRQFIQ
jgi:hypothetical protein